MKTRSSGNPVARCARRVVRQLSELWRRRRGCRRQELAVARDEQALITLRILVGDGVDVLAFGNGSPQSRTRPEQLSLVERCRLETSSSLGRRGRRAARAQACRGDQAVDLARCSATSRSRRFLVVGDSVRRTRSRERAQGDAGFLGRSSRGECRRDHEHLDVRNAVRHLERLEPPSVDLRSAPMARMSRALVSLRARQLARRSRRAGWAIRRGASSISSYADQIFIARAAEPTGRRRGRRALMWAGRR